jgi:hypothetical protein
MKTLTLETSRLIYELISNYESFRGWHSEGHHWSGKDEVGEGQPFVAIRESSYDFPRLYKFPAPSFSELCRIMPLIGKKLGWVDTSIKSYCLLDKYQDGPTEELAMQAVEKKLNSYL